MDDKQVKEIANKVLKVSVSLITLKPLFKKLISFDGLVFTWIAINVYYIGKSGISILMEVDSFMYSEELDESNSLFNLLSQFVPVALRISEIGVLLFVRKMYSNYFSSKLKQSLDFAKNLGVINTSEYEMKMLESKKQEYINEVCSMYKAGVFTGVHKSNLIDMAEQHYAKMISEIAIKNAYENGVITKEERNEKLNKANIKTSNAVEISNESESES